jgi:hypothetical protein
LDENSTGGGLGRRGREGVDCDGDGDNIRHPIGLHSTLVKRHSCSQEGTRDQNDSGLHVESWNFFAWSSCEMSSLVYLLRNGLAFGIYLNMHFNGKQWAIEDLTADGNIKEQSI